MIKELFCKWWRRITKLRRKPSQAGDQKWRSPLDGLEVTLRHQVVEGLVDLEDLELPEELVWLRQLRITSRLCPVSSENSAVDIEAFLPQNPDHNVFQTTQTIVRRLFPCDSSLEVVSSLKEQAELICDLLMAQAACNLQLLLQAQQDGAVSEIRLFNSQAVITDVDTFYFLDPQFTGFPEHVLKKAYYALHLRGIDEEHTFPRQDLKEVERMLTQDAEEQETSTLDLSG